MASSARILIVDDEPMNVEYLEQELGDLGYRTESAFGGKEALKKVAAGAPDLILLDVMMPDLDGITVCRMLKNDPATRLIPIVIMTALDAVEDRVRGIEAGADDFLTKPVDDRELLARIRTALKTKHAVDVTVDELESVTREQEKSERILQSVLPDSVAKRLKEGEVIIADRYDEVTILFSDIVDSTPLARKLPPSELVGVLDGVFRAFDELAEMYELEKIKTMGDGYMVIGGAPELRADHTEAVARMALAMRDFSVGLEAGPDMELMMRFGIDVGPVVAGVLGRDKFTYDVYGDAVNTASRMESQSLPGRIQVSDKVYQKLRDQFRFEPRGSIEVKGVGPMITYFLEGPVD